jgi:CRISPR-associated protein Csx17
MHEHPLHGCTPTPLAAYLKALAVLRLVTEAPTEHGGDPRAAGFWRNDVFVLRTELTKEQLRTFFLEHYRPTPLIAPWNGGSGFYFQEGKLKAKDPLTGKKLKTGVRNQQTEATKTVTTIAGGNTARFAEYREAIAVAKSIIEAFKLTEAPDGSASSGQKDCFIQTFRNSASDHGLEAMDCCVVITGDKTSFPPLFGTGGNDGNLDFTNNFMQRLLDVMDASTGLPSATSADSLDISLFNASGCAATDKAVGQFNPGSAGGPNASSGFEGVASVNPWDFILMLEGAMLFAASAVRRLESGGQSVLSAPFIVYSRLGTSGASNAVDDTESRNEVWMPIWPAPSSLAELKSLLGEGRATLDRQVVRDGLDFARSISRLGINRGIRSFQRYAFLKRQGKNYLATPLARIQVSRNPDADLIADLERHGWLASVQRYARDDNSPNSFRTAARQLDTALFALTERSERGAFQRVLRHVGRIDVALSSSPKSHVAVRNPAPRLSLSWATKAQDASPEFNIATALAGLSLRNAKGHFLLHIRRHLAAVSESLNKEGDRNWEAESRAVTWNAGSLTGNLSVLLHRRRLEADMAGIDVEGQLLASTVGANRGDIGAFLDDETDDSRIGELLTGLACVDLQEFVLSSANNPVSLPPAFGLLKIFFTPTGWLHALKWLPQDRMLVLPPEIPARLISGNVEGAVRIAWRGLSALGVRLPGRRPPSAVAESGPRWLAALCIPLTFAETGRLLRDLDLTPEVSADSPSETLAP